MSKKYTALGLMSGTSGDGVDASIVQSDGKTKYRLIIIKTFIKFDLSPINKEIIMSIYATIKSIFELNIIAWVYCDNISDFYNNISKDKICCVL